MEKDLQTTRVNRQFQTHKKVTVHVLCGTLHACTGHVGMFLFGVLSLTVTLLCIVEYITILSDITRYIYRAM